MDNLCHTLVGAVLAEAGLKRRTALGAATLMIGANFPDIDVVAVPFGAGLSFRRGWTHGVLALVVLPFVLTGLMMWWDSRRARHTPDRVRAIPRQLLLLSTLSIATHPTLDFLNTYGVRWLMPFSGRWFYGDSLFIVDPWLWLILAGGFVAARTRSGSTRARIALALAAAYIASMVGIAVVMRTRIASTLRAARGSIPAFMVAPVPINPLRRGLVYDTGDGYRSTMIRVLGVAREPSVETDVPKRRDDPAIDAAIVTPEFRAFLGWSRFPYFEVERDASGVTVRVSDARYATPGEKSWASATVRLPRVIAVPRS